MSTSQSVKVSDRTFSTITEAAEFHGVPLSTAAKRLGKGWTPEQAFGLDNKPSAGKTNSPTTGKTREVEYKGKVYPNLAKLAREYNIEPQLVRTRMHRGKTLSQALGDVTVSDNITALEKDVISAKSSSKLPRRNKKTISVQPTLNQEYKLDGNTFTTVESLAKHYHANPAVVKERLDSGWSVAQAVGLMSKPVNENPYQDMISLTVEGRSFQTINDIATHFKIESTDLIRELANGYDVSGAVEKLKRKHGNRPSIMVRGKSFPSLNKIAKHFKVNASSLYQRVKRGDPVEKAVNELEFNENDPSRVPGKKGRRGKPVEYNGMTFSSIREFAAHYNIDVHKVVYRLKQGFTHGQAIGREPIEEDKEIRESDRESIFYRGKEYRSVRALSKAFNIGAHKVRYRLKQGWSIEQAIDKAPPPRITRKKNSKQNENLLNISDLSPFTSEGKTYDTVKQLANAYGLSVTKVTGRLRNGWSVEESVELEERSRKRKGKNAENLIVGDTKFDSVLALSEHYDVSYRIVQYRLGQGATPAQAVGVDEWKAETHKGIELELEGKVYPSLVEAVKAFGKDYNKVLSRMHRNWTAEEALDLVSRIKPKSKRSGTLSIKNPSTSKGGKKSKSTVLKSLSSKASHNIALGDRTFSDINEFAKEIGVDPVIAAKRLNDGWTGDQIAGNDLPPNW